MSTMKLAGLAAAALASTLAITACDKSVSADGYSFGKPEFDRSGVQVEMVYYPSDVAFTREANKRGVIVSADRKVFAYAYVSGTEAKCTIHTTDPNVVYRPERYGHELMHCLHGRWHTDEVAHLNRKAG